MVSASYTPFAPDTVQPIRRTPTFVSPDTQCLLTIGKQRDWDFVVLGQAPLPLQKVQLGDWLVVPADQDDSHIPIRAWERVHAIYEAGLRPKGFVLVHELPKSLPGQVETRPREFSLSPTMKMVLTVCGIILALPVIAGGLVLIATAVAGLLAVLFLSALLLAGLAGLDPILVAVTSDDCWIEIDRWQE
jgi:hypothetical protein